MKHWVFLASAIVLLTQSILAAPCTSGSLANYIALGATGCTIGGNTLYDFQTLSGTAFATPIATQGITINPLGGAYNPGISVSTQMTAASGKLLEALFTYRISGNLFVGDSITLSASSETVDGAVTDIQNYCAGGTFGSNGVSACTGLAGSLLALDGVTNQASSSFSRTSFLSITDDFTLDGGLAGSASGGTFADSFTAVPEPSVFLLTALGITLALTGKQFQSLKRSRKRKRPQFAASTCYLFQETKRTL